MDSGASTRLLLDEWLTKKDCARKRDLPVFKELNSATRITMGAATVRRYLRDPGIHVGAILLDNVLLDNH